MKTNAGMILSHPSIIDMPMNFCSNGCIYCFMNNKDYKYNQEKCLKNLKQGIEKGKFFHRKAVEGYPITMSNISDMFAASNIKSAPQILDYMYSLGLNIYFQTKTSLKMIDVVKNHVPKKQIFYVTITTNDNETSKIIEPGAPKYEERVEVIKQLINMGHGVQVGINPTYYGFMNTENAVNTMQELKDIGVDGFVIQYLHLNKKIKEKYEKLPIIGGDETDRIMKRENYSRNEHFFELMRKFYPMVKFYNQPTFTNFWDNYKSVYKYLPTCQTFSNYCISKYGNNIVDINFDEYYEVMKGFEDFLGGYGKVYDEFIIGNNRSAWIGHPENQNIKSVKDLLRVFWNSKSIKSSPAFNELFTRVEKEGNEVIMRYNGGIFPWRLSRNDKEDTFICQNKGGLEMIKSF